MKLTDEELARIRVGAAAMGLTEASYLVESARLASPATPPPGSDRLVVDQGRKFSVTERRVLAAELGAVRRILSGMATNFGQLADVADRTGQQPSAAHSRATAAAITQHLAGMDATIGALDPRRPNAG